MINNVLNTSNINWRKKKTIPQRNETHKWGTKCGLLCSKYWIRVDSSYFTLSHTSVHGNKRFYFSDISDTPSHIKHAMKQTIEIKVFV